jgi:hypothetical protein
MAWWHKDTFRDDHCHGFHRNYVVVHSWVALDACALILSGGERLPNIHTAHDVTIATASFTMASRRETGEILSRVCVNIDEVWISEWIY